MKRLLCTTDGSYASEKAVDWAIEFTKMLSTCQLGVEITFLTVSAIPEESDPIPATPRAVALMKDAVDEQIYRELHSARARALKAGLDNITCAKASGRNIAAAIIDYAEAEKFEHIIVGSTGKTGVARVLLGSVASDVVAKAHCPVTVVR
jgi:nucleotide-binding universal stress UspA family protein